MYLFLLIKKLKIALSERFIANTLFFILQRQRYKNVPHNNTSLNRANALKFCVSFS